MNIFGKHIRLSVMLNVVLAALLGMVILTACMDTQASVSNDNATTAAQKWGAGPKITNFYEYQQELEIYEARDNPKLILNAYLQAMDGSLRCFGKVKGFGVPYSTEQSPPNDTNGKPVPEPNGLYPSQNTSADWVQLVQPDGSTTITFVEPSLIITAATLPCKPLNA
jgi:hypothetical protein